MNEVDITKFKSFPRFKEKFLTKFPSNYQDALMSDACWEWQGNKKKRNEKYGFIKFGSVCYFAHRISYLIFNGAIYKESMIMHTCDNPSCVNPKHLVLGNQSINMIDCVKRERHPATKLNEECVKVIKWMLKYQNYPGLAAKLAKVHNISTNQISLIKRNRCWSWVTV